MKKTLTMTVAALLIFGMITFINPAAADTLAEDVIGTMLVNSRMVYAMTKDALIADGGEVFASIEGNAALQTTGDGLVIAAAEQENPMLYLGKRLDNVDGIVSNHQAFHMKFKPSQKHFGLMMSADQNAGITIGADNEPLLFISGGEYMEPLNGNLRIEPDCWYHVLLAMDAEGVMQAALWKDGEEQNLASLNLPTGQRFGDYVFKNQSWEISVGFRGEATFTVDSYEYYTFDRYTEIGGEREELKALVFDRVIESMLENPQTLWYEGGGGFAENQGGEFGGGAAEKRYNEKEGRLELFSDEIAACVPFNTTLRDCGPDHRQQQAVLVRFQPENVSGFRFSFEGTDEIAIECRDGGPYLFDMGKVTSMAFRDYAQHHFTVKNDSLYYLLFAADENAMMRVFIWEEGNIAENQAYLEYDLYDGNDAIYDCDWKMFVGFNANGQFNLYEYWVYTFDRFRDDSAYLTVGE